MWRRKLDRIFQIEADVTDRLLITVRQISAKILRIARQPNFRRPLISLTGIMGITAIVALSVTGLFNYIPDTSPSFHYIPPPAGERQKYYIESTTGDLWNEFLSPYSDNYNAQNKYVGESFIFKNIRINATTLKYRYDTYIIINLIKFIPRSPSELKKLKDGDVVDIIGVCAGLSDKYVYVLVGNCQFLPPGSAPLPLPGGPAPLAPTY